MSPYASGANIVDRLVADVPPCSQDACGLRRGPDVSHNVSIQSNAFSAREGFVPVILAFSDASLGSHVGAVVGERAKKQMARIGTRRIVAAVQNKQAIRDRAVDGFPHQAVRPLVPLGATQEAVAPFMRQTRPGPARVGIGWFDDLLVQTLQQVTCLRIAVAALRAETLLVAQRTTALFTGSRVDFRMAHPILSIGCWGACAAGYSAALRQF